MEKMNYENFLKYDIEIESDVRPALSGSCTSARFFKYQCMQRPFLRSRGAHAIGGPEDCTKISQYRKEIC